MRNVLLSKHSQHQHHQITMTSSPIPMFNHQEIWSLLLLLGSFLPCLIPQITMAAQDAMTLYATCDDVMKVYFDGELQPETDAMKHWGQTSQLSIPAGTRVLAIECRNLGAQYGILASTSTGLKTGTSWRCSSSAIDGWTRPDFVFPPDTFASANTLGNNGVQPWGNRSHEN